MTWTINAKPNSRSTPRTAVSGGGFASAGGQQVFGCTANDLRGSMVDVGSTYVDNSLNAGRDIKIDKRQVNNRIRGEE